MKVLIPAAGLGTRLRPHTHHRPKPLVPVAGSTVLGHVLDHLQGIAIEEIVFVIGHLGDQIQRYVDARYEFVTRYVVQSELRGQAHAIALAREWLAGPLLILFVDTIFEADLSGLESESGDGVIYTSEVDDPRRFGIVVTAPDGHIEALEEKPVRPRSNLAIGGLYYVKSSEWLLAAIDELIAADRQVKGEFYLASALQIMIDQGARFVTRPLAVWEDCGTREALLRSNRHLLRKIQNSRPPRGTVSDSVVIPPVIIGSGATVKRSVVGPHAVVGDGCRIEGSIVGPFVSLAREVEITGAILNDTIVDSGATINGIALSESLVGAGARIRADGRHMNVGDTSEVDL